MLAELRVKNFALIDQLNIQFKKGFNVLSGETGSGKSILLKSLSVLMGAPSSHDFIGPYGDSAQVEGLFDISERPDIKARMEELGFENDSEELIVRRSLGKKSRVYVNGTLITLTELKNVVTPILEIAGPFSAPLMEMTGQHDTKQLLSTHYHRFLLDLFGGLQKDLESYKLSFENYLKLKQEVEELKNKSSERSQQLDYLKFQIQDLEDFNLNTEEDSKLKERISRLQNKQKLISFLSESDYALSQSSESALSQIHKVIKSAEAFGDFEKITACLENLKAAKALIEDVSFELSNFENDAFSEEDDLDTLTARYTKLRSLQKKYGESFESLEGAYDQLKKEITTLEDLDSILEVKEKEVRDLKTQLSMKAGKMHELRSLAAKSIEVKVNEQLQDLNMKGVLFFVGLEKSSDLNKYGCSKIEFLVKNYHDDELRPLSKTASGGELSRILLSIKSVLGEDEWPRTYLFDEVDTGVSGPTAELVGKKLKTLAFEQQILCVTHLPQVAALGDHHYSIEKILLQNEAKIKIRELNQSERVNEVARLISGEQISESSRQHARALISGR